MKPMLSDLSRMVHAMCLWLTMNRLPRQMMGKRPAGLRMANSQSEKRAPAGAFTRAISFAQPTGGLLMQARHSSMARTTRDSGTDHYFSNRLDFISLQNSPKPI